MSRMRALTLLAVLCATTALGILDLPLRVHKRHVFTYYVGNNDDEYDPVQYDEEYHVVQDVKLGNPPRSFALSLATDDYRTAVFDSASTQKLCTNIANYTLAHPKTYNPSRSTTVRRRGNDKDMFALDTFVNMQCHGDPSEWSYYADAYKVSDDIRINGLLSKSTDFTVILSLHATLDNQWRADGVLGLMRFYDSNGTTTTLQQLARIAGPLSEVTLTVNRSVSPVQDGAVDGTLTLGGSNAKDCDSNWTRMKDVSRGTHFWMLSWNVGVRSFQIGSYKSANYSREDLDGAALVAFHSSIIEAPPDGFNAVVEQTGATLDRDGKYVVACSRVAGLPPLEFDLVAADNSTLKFIVEARDYVRNIYPRSDNNCALQVRSTNGWSFGISSVPSWCWRLDYALMDLYIATSKHS